MIASGQDKKIEWIFYYCHCLSAHLLKYVQQGMEDRIGRTAYPVLFKIF